MRGLINGAHVHLYVHGDEVLEYVPDFLIQDSIDYTGSTSNISQAAHAHTIHLAWSEQKEYADKYSYSGFSAEG